MRALLLEMTEAEWSLMTEEREMYDCNDMRTYPASSLPFSRDSDVTQGALAYRGFASM